jgi:hypothetical protein
MSGMAKPEMPADLVVPEPIEHLAAKLGMNKHEVEFLLHTAHEEAVNNDILLHHFRSLLTASKLLFSEQANRHVTAMRMHDAAYQTRMKQWHDRQELDRKVAKQLADEEYFKSTFRRAIAAYDYFVDMLRSGYNLGGFTVQERRLFDALVREYPDLKLEYDRSYFFFQKVTLKGPAPKLTPQVPWLGEVNGLLANLRDPSI